MTAHGGSRATAAIGRRGCGPPGPRWNASSTEGGYILFHFPTTNTPQLAGVGSAGFVNFTPDDGTGCSCNPVQLAAQRFTRSPGSARIRATRWSATGPATTGRSTSTRSGDRRRITSTPGRNGSARPRRGTRTITSRRRSTRAGTRRTTRTTCTATRSRVAAPPPTAGAFRPTSLFSYDAYDNVTAYCDPVAAHALGSDWTAPPTAPVPGAGGLCPSASAAAVRYQWNPVTAEPYGELIAATAPATAASAPSGYQRTFSYDAGPQGGTDYGLPTRVSGTAITQTDPTTPSRQPQQTYWYDGNGNVVCYGTGSGQWLATYDTLGRILSSADPDDTSSGTGVCGKTGAQAGWNTTSRIAYLPDGSVGSKQTASQAANGTSTTFTYDAGRRCHV